MTDNPTYVVTDVELDGPVPGRHSMLSFASVAVSAEGRTTGEFEAVLRTLDGATADPGTTKNFWLKHPQAYAEATRDPQPPAEVMARFTAWVRGLPGEPIFASHPLGLDGPWIDFYLQRFTDEQLFEGKWRQDRLFRDAPLCLMSFASGRLGWPLWKCQPTHYPPEWLGHHEHTHRAIDDARGYAQLLARLLAKPA